MNQRRKITNPTGKGGFGDHPENAKKGGRPPLGQTFKDILERQLDSDFVEKGKDGKPVNRGKTKDLLVQAWVRYALAGSWQHLQGIVDRIDGSILPEIDGVNENQLKLFILNQISLKADFKFDKEGNLLNSKKQGDNGNGRFNKQKSGTDTDSVESN